MAKTNGRFDLSSTPVGRAVLSTFLLIVLSCVLTANVPDSSLRRALLRVNEPLINGSGLDQRWNVFAPDPRRQILAMEARIRDADGTVRTWRPPDEGPLVGAYWDYHWRKWLESTIADFHRDDLWPQTARWLARRERDRGRDPKTITLTRSWSNLNPPGSSPIRSPWRSLTYYRFKVPAGPLEGG